MQSTGGCLKRGGNGCSFINLYSTVRDGNKCVFSVKRAGEMFCTYLQQWG